ncbi:MAG: SufS family cysteine desulfurase [Bdellovibrionaceae bacterium]|nr:SufS family cysteine desulfurase [Pseudobdellovibrionaceae bacterium]
MALNDIKQIKSLFPTLHQKVNGADLVYLDSAATTMKPKSVIDRITRYYTLDNSNVHRGAHYLSQRGTDEYEKARQTVARFINAQSESEIVFTRGTTESINLIAHSYGKTFLKAGDEVIVSIMEHHANLVPWHVLKNELGIVLKFVYLNQEGDLDLVQMKNLVTSKTKLISITGCSNTLGTFTDLKFISALAKSVSAKLLVDAAQLVSQKLVDVQSIDCDFLVFSGHKLFGPTGIGVMYAKKEILQQMPPYQTGGSMISQVSEQSTTFNQAPFRFEAGTPHIEGVVGLMTAIEFFNSVDKEWLRTQEDHLLTVATRELLEIGGVIVYGSQVHKSPIISFNIEGVHHSDVAALLDQQGVAVRSGHHCTQPLMNYLKTSGTVRASFSIYNDLSDVEKFVASVKKAKDILL